MARENNSISFDICDDACAYQNLGVHAHVRKPDELSGDGLPVFSKEFARAVLSVLAYHEGKIQKEWIAVAMETVQSSRLPELITPCDREIIKQISGR